MIQNTIMKCFSGGWIEGQSSICSKEIEVLRSSIVIMLSSYDVEGLNHLLRVRTIAVHLPINEDVSG